MLIEVKKISKKYNQRIVLDDISFSISSGEIVGFVGPNGAGKTTTLKICAGLVRPTTGQVIIDGFDIKKDLEKAMSVTGVLLDSNGFYDNLSGLANLKLIAGINGKSKEDVFQAAQRVQMSNRINDKVRTYSFGMKQRLSMAKILLCKPKLIIMDEPLNGIDHEGTLLFRSIIQDFKNNNCGILISSHLLSELEKSVDRVIFIKSGKIRRDLNLKDFEGCLIKICYLSSGIKEKVISHFQEMHKVTVDGDFVKIKCSVEQIPSLQKYVLGLGVLEKQINIDNSLEEEYIEILGENIIE